jgi:hypothetical protein
MSEIIGYTKDGLVFLTATTELPDGKMAQVTFSWEPKRARQLAEQITFAAKQVDKPLIVVPHIMGHG